jgi:hypothetical protein
MHLHTTNKDTLKYTKTKQNQPSSPKTKTKNQRFRVLKLTFIVKHDGFLLLHVKSKVQNVVVVACCVQNLEAKQQNTQAKPRRNAQSI